jgi:hypothetical protein
MDTAFAYWVPNVSGGLVVSDWETETDWTYDYTLDRACDAPPDDMNRTSSRLRPDSPPRTTSTIARTRLLMRATRLLSSTVKQDTAHRSGHRA